MHEVGNGCVFQRLRSELEAWRSKVRPVAGLSAIPETLMFVCFRDLKCKGAIPRDIGRLGPKIANFKLVTDQPRGMFAFYGS